jgi:predicted HicB family RNase H-like nuclease
VVDLRYEIYFEGSSVDEMKHSIVRAVDQYSKGCERSGEHPGRFQGLKDDPPRT